MENGSVGKGTNEKNCKAEGKIYCMKGCEIPIFLAADDNYAPFLLITILSVSENTKSLCHFYVFDGGISSGMKNVILTTVQTIRNAEISFCSTRDSMYLKDVKTKGHVTLPAYYRLLIADMFPQIDKAIYLDVDTVAFGDIEQLYDIDLGEYVLGAVQNNRNEQLVRNYKSRIGMSEESKYFNSGVLLIDLKKWRDLNLTKVVFHIEYETRSRRILNDQDVLNKCFENNFLELDAKFNNINILDNGCIIRHYEGKPKPWEISPELCVGEFADYVNFWQYAKQLSLYGDVLKKARYRTMENVKR